MSKSSCDEMVKLFHYLPLLSMVYIVSVSVCGLALPKFSAADWTPSLIDDGACITPPPAATAFNTNWLLSALKDDWYVPIASRMFIYTRATYQKKNVTAEFLTNLCPRFKPSASVAIIIGLKEPSKNATTPSPPNNATANTTADKSEPILTTTVASAEKSTPHTTEATVLGCHSNKIGEQNCLLQLNSDEILGEIESTAVWTDNAKFILLTFCSNMKNKMWALLSNQRNISNTDRDIVQKKVESYGFKLNMAYSISYDNCTHDGERPAR